MIENQRITLEKFAANPPSNLAELREYAQVCGEINKDGNGDVYFLNVSLIDRIIENNKLIHKLLKQQKGGK